MNCMTKAFQTLCNNDDIIALVERNTKGSKHRSPACLYHKSKYKHICSRIINRPTNCQPCVNNI
ncbi:hypothetical protein Hanom_Chr04g00286861 [Helianthus anomalus]